MAGFLYYLPEAKLHDLVEKNRFKQSAMEQWKLDDVLSDCSVYPDHIACRELKGPDAGTGMLLTPRALDGEIGAQGYDPRTQEWRLAEDCSGRWIGWTRDEPPGPQDLLKRDALPCRYVFRDAKENEWAIVTARSRKTDHISLPSTYTFVDNKLTTRIKPKYQGLFDLSGTIYDHLAVLFAGDESNKEFIQSEEFMVRSAVRAIGEIYRFGIAEAAVFDSLDYQILITENITAILMCLVDQPLLEEFREWNAALKEKKSTDLAPSSPSSSSGSEGSTPTIDPAVVESLSLK